MDLRSLDLVLQGIDVVHAANAANTHPSNIETQNKTEHALSNSSPDSPGKARDRAFVVCVGENTQDQTHGNMQTSFAMSYTCSGSMLKMPRQHPKHSVLRVSTYVDCAERAQDKCFRKRSRLDLNRGTTSSRWMTPVRCAFRSRASVSSQHAGIPNPTARTSLAPTNRLRSQL